MRSDLRLPRSGPLLYDKSAPEAVKFGSLGSFLAARIADKLGIEGTRSQCDVVHGVTMRFCCCCRCHCIITTDACG